MPDEASHAFPIAQLDLVAELRRLRASPMPHKHVAKTVLRYDDLRIVLMAFCEGAQLASHRTERSVVLQVLEGRVVVSILGDLHVLSAMQLLAIGPGLEHSISALEDASVLVTVGGC